MYRTGSSGEDVSVHYVHLTADLLSQLSHTKFICYSAGSQSCPNFTPPAARVFQSLLRRQLEFSKFYSASSQSFPNFTPPAVRVFQILLRRQPEFSKFYFAGTYSFPNFIPPAARVFQTLLRRQLEFSKFYFAGSQSFPNFTPPAARVFQIYFPLIYIGSSDKAVLFGDMIGGADVICAQESGALQPYLENYTEVGNKLKL